MDRCLIALITMVINIILIGVLLAILNKYPQQVLSSFKETVVVSSVGCCDDETNTETQGFIPRIKYEPEISSIGSMQDDGIIRGWRSNEKLLEKGRRYPNIKLTMDCFKIEEKGIYKISSFVSFWGRERDNSYKLTIKANGSSLIIHSSNITFNRMKNPNVASCDIITEVNVKDKAELYFKVTNPNSKVMMCPNHCLVEIIKRE